MAQLKQTILGAKDGAGELTKFRVEAWGCDVYIRRLRSSEKDAFEASTLRRRNQSVGAELENFRARFLVKCLCDEDGARIFEDSDAEALGAKSGVIVDLVFAEAQRVNGITKDDVDFFESGS